MLLFLFIKADIYLKEENTFKYRSALYTYLQKHLEKVIFWGEAKGG